MKKYLVGGAVRDKIMGLIPKDWDYVFIDATEEELLNLGYLRISRSFPVFSHDDHPQDQFSLARTEKKTGPGYTGFIVETENIKLEEDLRRRDFTINSMAMDNSGNVIDPFGGKLDIANKVLRHTGPHFVEDPLRIIRTARFAARLHFNIAEETKTLINEMLAMGALTEIPSIRIALEFDKAINDGYGYDFVRILNELNILSSIAGIYDLDKIINQIPKLKRVKDKNVFYSILFYDQKLDLKQKDFFVASGHESFLNCQMVYDYKDLVLNYTTLSNAEKIQKLYFSRLRYIDRVLFTLKVLKITESENDFIKNKNYRQIVSDWKILNKIDFKTFDFSDHETRKIQVERTLIESLGSNEKIDYLTYYLDSYPLAMNHQVDSCSEGWLSLLEPVLKLMNEMNLKESSLDSHVKFTTIKEKYGNLSIYTNFSTDDLDKVIEQAEELSATTCEACGELGEELKSKGWIYTGCAKHIRP